MHEKAPSDDELESAFFKVYKLNKPIYEARYTLLHWIYILYNFSLTCLIVYWPRL